MKLDVEIIEGRDYLALLTSEVVETTAEWRAFQNIKPVEGEPFYKAYPLKGGVALVQKSRIKVIRKATPGDCVEFLNIKAFNPAAESFRKYIQPAIDAAFTYE